MRNWDRIQDIFSWMVESSIFTLKWWSTQHLSNDRWSARHLFMTYGVHRIYSRERYSPQHLLSWDMDLTTFTSKKCSPHNLLSIDGVHSIDTQDIFFWREMESTAFTHERCNCCAPFFPCSPRWGWQRYRSLVFVSHSSSSLIHTIY